MANEALIDAIKQIVTLGKSGDADGANARWCAMFTNPEFAAHRPEDQRQALKFVILAKRTSAPSASFREVHRAAIGPLQAMVAGQPEPVDFEMLGLCHLLLGDLETAATTFRSGLEAERAINPSSDLCGRLMKHLSAT